MDEKYNQAIKALSGSLYMILKEVPEEIQKNVREICIRTEKPVIFMCTNDYLFLRKDGKLTRNLNLPLKIASQRELEESLKTMCKDSVYSYTNEIKNGFLTLKGGHRVGLCGTAVMEDEKIVNVRDISTLSVRIARQMRNSADELLSSINNKFNGIILAGIPASGKTTILRELARKLSLLGEKVSVIDERNEFSGTYAGLAQNDLGFCDILNGYPKAEGLTQAIRTLSPNVIVCDEIGTERDIQAIRQAVHAGVKLIVSVHAGSIDDFSKRKHCMDILNTEAFDVLAMMWGRTKPGVISQIYKVGANVDKTDRFALVNSVVNSAGVCDIA